MRTVVCVRTLYAPYWQVWAGEQLGGRTSEQVMVHAGNVDHSVQEPSAAVQAP